MLTEETKQDILKCADENAEKYDVYFASESNGIQDYIEDILSKDLPNDTPIESDGTACILSMTLLGTVIPEDLLTRTVQDPLCTSFDWRDLISRKFKITRDEVNYIIEGFDSPNIGEELSERFLPDNRNAFRFGQECSRNFNPDNARSKDF